MIPRIVLPILLVLALCMSQGALADSPKPRPTPHHSVISAISADSITVDQAGGPKTYKITKDTEITFKGDTVTVDKLAVGMRVTVEPDSTDDTAAGQINANDPPK